MTTIEIMSPAGSWESLSAALNGGANSVYFGVSHLNMRSRGAKNFTIADLPTIVQACKEKNCKTYLTVNIVLYDTDLHIMKQLIDAAKNAGVTAIIAADLAAIQYAKEIDMQIHISTQANVSNLEAVKFFSTYANVIVLARELTLPQIKHITEEIKKQHITGPNGKLIQIEIFVHGALCVSISGKCYMSLAQYNSSANRGACLQVCRRAYRVIDEETGEELVIDNKYIMSPKDLCTIRFVDQLIEAGVCVFKIEGRGRSADYVSVTTQAYREAADAYEAGTYTKEKVEKWEKQLETVFNRGFWHGGYYLGKQLGEWSGSYGSQATKEKIVIGKIAKFYPKASVIEFKLETGELHTGDNLTIIGPETGSLNLLIKHLRIEGKECEQAKKGDLITFYSKQPVKKNDKIFLVNDRTAV